MQYIESRLVSLAGLAKRCLLDNGNSPALPSLSESDAADAEGFLSEMMLCFPVLGLSVFTAAEPIRKSDKLLYIKSRGIKAEGMETQDGFVVRSGSGLNKNEAASCHTYLKVFRAALRANGVLLDTQDGYTFAQDYVFASPSTAAGVILGRSANGREEWKNEEGKTLKYLQQATDEFCSVNDPVILE